LDAAQKQIIARSPTQMAEIRETITVSGMEGVAMEYWSPAPFWKSNGDYIGGTIASTNPVFLDDFGDALVNDVSYLVSNNIPVIMWGLQNEPATGEPNYPTCEYSVADYAATFAAVAPKVRTNFPNILIHANSQSGASGPYGTALRANPANLNFIDAWTIHRGRMDANDQITSDHNLDAGGKPVFSNEYHPAETNEWEVVNTAQSIMNWFAFQQSPTWFWLHALKPLNDSVATLFALGYWRRPNDMNFTFHPELAAGHWTWNPYNWNALSGFLRYLPWDSRRVHVNERAVLFDQRILAWKTPDNRLGVALSNRSPTNFVFKLDWGRIGAFTGHRFSVTNDNLNLGDRSGRWQQITLPPYSVEFWVEQNARSLWRAAYWPERPEGQPTLDFADPDGDGLCNLCEYVTGSNPTNSVDAQPLALAGEADSSGEYRLLTRPLHLDSSVAMKIELSHDLASWTEVIDLNATPAQIAPDGRWYYSWPASPGLQATFFRIGIAASTGP
jgi:hypothetical protein